MQLLLLLNPPCLFCVLPLLLLAIADGPSKHHQALWLAGGTYATEQQRATAECGATMECGQRARCWRRCESHISPRRVCCVVLTVVVSLPVRLCFCSSEVFESASDIYLVLECAQGGELFDRIKDAGAFSEKQASTILRMMCEGLKYMSVATPAMHSRRASRGSVHSAV